MACWQHQCWPSLATTTFARGMGTLYSTTPGDLGQPDSMQSQYLTGNEKLGDGIVHLQGMLNFLVFSVLRGYFWWTAAGVMTSDGSQLFASTNPEQQPQSPSSQGVRHKSCIDHALCPRLLSAALCRRARTCLQAIRVCDKLYLSRAQTGQPILQSLHPCP